MTRWTIAGHQRERMSSSIVTATSRGLPIPLFTFKVAANAQTINPDVDAVFKVEITNQGAPDRWDLTTNNGTWEFWRDNGDNVLCVDTAGCGAGVAQDTLMTDGDDAGSIVDTGRMDPTMAIVVLGGAQGQQQSVCGRLLDQPHGDGRLGRPRWGSGRSRRPDPRPADARHRCCGHAAARTGLAQPDDWPAGRPGRPAQRDRDRRGRPAHRQLDCPETLGTGTLTDYVVEYKGPSDASWSSEGTVSTATSQVLTGLTKRTPCTRSASPPRRRLGTGGWCRHPGHADGGRHVHLHRRSARPLCPAVPDVPAAANRVDYTLAVEEGRGLARHGHAAAALDISPGGQAAGHAWGRCRTFRPGRRCRCCPRTWTRPPTGRVILSGGGLVTGRNTQTDTEYFADWHVPADSNKRRYSGTAVLTLWVARRARCDRGRLQPEQRSSTARRMPTT